EDPKPFIWTKTAEEILDSLARICRRISGAGHYVPQGLWTPALISRSLDDDAWASHFSHAPE
ncbi:hypothetical protein ACIRFH_34355, partial [Streptomyces sp. NPDC093586]|uniref:hypothetical protein n=1 Tax=Streptomyces sp. NPDC093586 TaxID=3366042 RepID=UPI0037FAF4C1